MHPRPQLVFASATAIALVTLGFLVVEGAGAVGALDPVKASLLPTAVPASGSAAGLSCAQVASIPSTSALPVPTSSTSPGRGACAVRVVSPPSGGAGSVSGVVRAGVKAVKPSVSVTDPTVAGITSADVAHYLTTVPQAGKGFASTGVAPTLASLKFSPARDVNSTLNTALTVDATALLCVAELKGDFVVYQPIGPPVTVHTLFIVFDARSGDLLSHVVMP